FVGKPLGIHALAAKAAMDAPRRRHSITVIVADCDGEAPVASWNSITRRARALRPDGTLTWCSLSEHAGHAMTSTMGRDALEPTEWGRGGCARRPDVTPAAIRGDGARAVAATSPRCAGRVATASPVGDATGTSQSYALMCCPAHARARP